MGKTILMYPLKTYRKVTHAFIAISFLIAMGSANAQLMPGTIIFGVAPGPYGALIKDAIEPGLNKKGYRVVIKEFSDYVQPNLALANKGLDANLFQHQLYLEKFSADKGLKLSPVISVPTAALGLYSNKIKSIDELKSGDLITIANDPTNLARALRFLASLNLITIKKDINPTQASEKDVDQNPKKLVIKPLEAAQLPRALDAATASIVNGNYAIAARLSLSSAIKLEQLVENTQNLVAVRTEDLDLQYAKDIKAVIESSEFLAVIDSKNHIYKEFQKPQWLKSRIQK